MTSPILADLTAEVVKTRGVIRSATATINGISAKVQKAVEEALANGATAEELAPITDVIAGLDADDNELAAAIAANP